MYNLFMNMFNSASHLVDLGRRQDVVPGHRESPSIEPVDEITSIENNNIDPELDILETEFGSLTKGKTIEIGLHRLLELIPRERRKADAYKGLKSKLSKLGVEFIITSRHPKNFNNHEDFKNQEIERR